MLWRVSTACFDERAIVGPCDVKISNASRHCRHPRSLSRAAPKVDMSTCGLGVTWAPTRVLGAAPLRFERASSWWSIHRDTGGQGHGLRCLLGETPPS